MNKIAAIVLSLILAMAVGLSGCVTISPPAAAPERSPTAIERPPASPSNLSAEAVSYDTVKLQWIDNSDNEHGFRIYRDNKPVATVGRNSTTYQLAGLEPATTYQYLVKAYNQAGESLSSVCTVSTPNPPSPAPSPEPTIEDIFLSRWGHTYYNNAPRVSYDLDQIEKLLIEIVCQVPWQSYYKAGVFDCSEKSAYLEYVFERHGYTAEMAEGEGHAWVRVYNDVASCWLSIEATLPVGTLTPPHPYTPTIGGIVECRFTLERKWEDIYHVTRISEYDWWDSPLADLLVEASDRAK